MSALRNDPSACRSDIAIPYSAPMFVQLLRKRALKKKNKESEHYNTTVGNDKAKKIRKRTLLPAKKLGGRSKRTECTFSQEIKSSLGQDSFVLLGVTYVTTAVSTITTTTMDGNVTKRHLGNHIIDKIPDQSDRNKTNNS